MGYPGGVTKLGNPECLTRCPEECDADKWNVFGHNKKFLKKIKVKVKCTGIT